MNGQVSKALRRSIYGAGMPRADSIKYTKARNKGMTLVCAGLRKAYLKAKKEYKQLKSKKRR